MNEELIQITQEREYEGQPIRHRICFDLDGNVADPDSTGFYEEQLQQGIKRMY